MNRLRQRFRLTDGNLITDLATWLILLLPLIIYASVIRPFGFGRLELFIAGLSLLLAGAVLTSRWRQPIAWWRSAIPWLLAGWLLAALISAGQGVQFQLSFWGSISRGAGWIFFLGLFVMTVLLLLLVRERSNWLKIYGLISWVGSLSGLITLLQRFDIQLIYRLDTSERLTGFMGNPIFLGMLLLLTFFVTLYYLLWTTGWRRSLYLIGALLQLSALAFTASRGPIIGWIVGALIAAIGLGLIYRQNWRWNWRWASLSALGVAALGVLLWLERANLTRIFVFSLKSDSIRSRLLAWDVLRDAVADRPWWGWGLENIGSAFSKFYRAGLGDLGVEETLFDRAHNFFLDHLLTNGWVGLILILILIVVTTRILLLSIRRARLADDKRTAVLLVMLLATGGGYLTSLITGFDVLETLIIGTVMLTGVVALTAPVLSKENVADIRWLILLPMAGLAFWLVMDLRYFWPAFVAGRYANIANRLADLREYPTAHRYFNLVQDNPNPYLYLMLGRFPSFARQYTYVLLDQKNAGGAKGMAVDGLVILERIQKANPGNPTLLMDQPLLNIIISQFEPDRLRLAKEQFAQLIKANPNREYLYLNWARVLTGLKEYDEAKATFDKLQSLVATPADTEFWLAVWGTESKKMSSAEIVDHLKISAERQASLPVGNEPVIKQMVPLLVNAKSWPAAAYYQNRIVEIEPNNLDERINLAMIYREMGLYQQAGEQARIVLEKDPSSLEETKTFLQSIGQSL